MHGGPRLRRVLIVGTVLTLGIGFAFGTVAACDAIAPVGATGSDGADTVGTERPIGTNPLANESGTTEVVVRFTPFDDPDTEADAVVDELREHAVDEQSAFEEFVDTHEAVEIESEFWLANAILVSVDANAVAVDDLLAVSNVTSIHENVVIETSGVDADERDVSAQPTGSTGEYTPGLGLIGAPATWERFDTRGAGATVAVIDTGVDPDHQDIDLHGWAEFDENGTLVSDDVSDANDPNGHGTHVAGTVAGGNASGTYIGVAPDASVYGINTFGGNGTTTFAGVLAGMEHATANEDVDILQMSLGTNGSFDGFIQPVRNARAADRIVVAASGNTGHLTSASPANTYDSLAVGAVRNDRTVAVFSSGETINKTAAFRDPPPDWPAHYVVPDVTAPGVGVVSTEAGTVDGYVEQQGTSMAAPHVSGIAALAVSATDDRIESDDLQSVIVDTAVHPDDSTEPDDRHGHGVVDAEAAVEASIEATPPTPTPTPPTPTPTPTEAETEEPEVVDPAVNDDAPGFGTGVGAVAIVVTALVATVVGRRS